VPPINIVPFIIYDVITVKTIVNSYITIHNLKKRAQKFSPVIVNVTPRSTIMYVVNKHCAYDCNNYRKFNDMRMHRVGYLKKKLT
jgi:hypothetical protein